MHFLIFPLIFTEQTPPSSSHAARRAGFDAVLVVRVGRGLPKFGVGECRRIYVAAFFFIRAREIWPRGVGGRAGGPLVRGDATSMADMGGSSSSTIPGLGRSTMGTRDAGASDGAGTGVGAGAQPIPAATFPLPMGRVI